MYATRVGVVGCTTGVHITRIISTIARYGRSCTLVHATYGCDGQEEADCAGSVHPDRSTHNGIVMDHT